MSAEDDLGSSTLMSVLSSSSANNYSNLTGLHEERPGSTLQVVLFSIICAVAVFLNATVLIYILAKKTWKMFVSSHFIAHLMMTNLLALTFIMPMFINNMRVGENYWENGSHPPFMCRIQTFATVTIWAVINYMVTCVAGVHLQTFARIHYDQLFGLRPAVICVISWVIGCVLGLPAITNSDVVRYDANYHYCVWHVSVSGYKAIVYMILLGSVMPSMLTWYAYFRVLGILFHSPVVFEALGLYKSRWLVYWFVLSPLVQMPFFAVWIIKSWWQPHTIWYNDWPQVTFFIANLHLLLAPIFYGMSMFIMKEEDMSVQARNMHKGATYHPPAVIPQQL